MSEFVDSLNKFSSEFPDLRGDEQTKEELLLRLDNLSDEMWEFIEVSSVEAQEERARIMATGFIEHELEQLTISA